MGIGPSTKETSKHHFKDPMVKLLGEDSDIDFMGIMLVGTPQDNRMKYFVSEKCATWLEAMRADGAIVSTDGWGNSDVDFANIIENIGKREIPVVGIKFIGSVAQFVVTNPYLDTIVDINKSASGKETEIVGENNISELDCKKALAFLKLKMRG